MATSARKRDPKVEMLVDPELLAMIDEAAAARYNTRTAWLIEAAVQRLERERVASDRE
jgi:uncharacterized protein (DUF1778 family)